MDFITRGSGSGKRSFGLVCLLGMDKPMQLFLSRLEFLDRDEKALVGEKLGHPDDWSRVTPSDVATWLGRSIRARWNASELRRRWESDLRLLERPGFSWVARGDSDYPAALAEVAQAPWGLWIRGAELALDRSWVGVVGTRYPSEQAKMAAFELGRDLAQAEAVVVSGLAWGIDGASHRGALETGRTVAVLGCGIDQVCPTGHRNLAARILGSGGSLVSEYGPGEPALGYRFVERNRVISGLSRTVVLVQAPLKSGALWTAEFALDQGRDLVVHQAGLDGDRGAGGRNLVRQGAPVIDGALALLDLWKTGAVVRRDHPELGDW